MPFDECGIVTVDLDHEPITRLVCAAAFKTVPACGVVRRKPDAATALPLMDVCGNVADRQTEARDTMQMMFGSEVIKSHRLGVRTMCSIILRRV